MNISEIAIKKPITTIMGMLIVLVVGIFSFFRVPLDLFPNLNVPVAIVSTNYSGAGPQEIESIVTRNIESVMATVTNTRSITSETTEGNSLVIIQFNDGTNMDFATLEMRERLDLIKNSFPDGVSDPTVMRIDPNSMIPVAQIGVSSESLSDIELTNFVEDNIQPRLERILGVASVNVRGGAEREIVINVDPQKIENYGLSILQLSDVIRSENINLPGGSIQYGSRDLNIKTKNEFTSMDDLKYIPLVLPEGQIIYLNNIATIDDTLKKPTTINRINGDNNIGLILEKQTDANTVNVVNRIRREIDLLNNEYQQVNIDIILDQAEIIEQSLNTVTTDALLGGIFAIILLLMFLKSLRVTFIIAISIPISIVATFVLMFLSGTTLNLISLGGLALGLGMMVDDSILVIENIYRHKSEGKSAINAAISGAKQVAAPVVASTLTTAAVFIPIIFTEGWAAELFKEMALTVTFSLLSATVVSLTAVPMLSSLIIKEDEDLENSNKLLGRAFTVWESLFDRIYAFYDKTLRKALNRPVLTILSVVVITLISVISIPLIGLEFLPSADEGSFIINIKYPEGTTIEKTNTLSEQIEETISKMPDVKDVFVTVGGGGGFGSGRANSNSATLTVNLVDRRNRKMSTPLNVEAARNKLNMIPGADINIRMSDGAFSAPGGGAPIVVEISGHDIDTLMSLANQIENKLAQVEGTRQVQNSVANAIPEVAVYVNRYKASRYGINSAAVASNLRIALEGQVATRYRIDGEEIDIRIQFPENERKTLAQLNSIKITSPIGRNVTLGDIATIEQELGPLSISRKDQNRIVTVTSQVFDRTAASIISEFRNELNTIDIPDGYSVTFGGDNEEMVSSFQNLAVALILSILLIYMVMASQFESLLQPFIIIFSIPLAFSGAAMGLFLTGRTFNVVSFIGVIVLSGIVVNNAIILVDFINKLREDGYTINDAIIESVKTRFRPIIMTTLTTVLAMLPLALGIGEGAEIQAPLATVVIFGLMFSTILTLIVIPIIYYILDILKTKLKVKRHAKINNKISL